jgi:hypothetical protein
MVIALGGCGAAAATVLLASVETNVAGFCPVCVDAAVQDVDVRSSGDTRHV